MDVQALALGINDVMDGKKARMSEEDMTAARTKMQQEMMAKQKQIQEEMAKEKEAKGKIAKESGEKFLTENKSKSDIKVTESGLQYQILTAGKGKSPKPDDRVKVHYRGTLIDGTEFDSSYKRNAPAEFPVGGVIKGWTEALQIMKKGAKWKLFIPSDLAYGPRGTGNIPANSVLIFDVELLEINKPK